MDGSVACDPIQIDIEAPTTPRERGVVGSLERDSHQRKYGSQKTLSLAQWEIEDEAQRQSRLNRVIGELPLSPSSSSWGRFPGGDYSEASLPPY